jgi:hypothetical protein
MTDSSPAETGSLVTPSDSGNVSARALWIGTGGNLKVDFAKGGTETFYNVPSGFLLPVMVSRVYSVGTTASNILALR